MHSCESNYASAEAIILYNELENYTIKIAATSPKGYMTVVVSQIGGHLSVYSVFFLVYHQRNIKGPCPHYWPFVMGIHQGLVDSPHKGPVMWKKFLCHVIIMNHDPPCSSILAMAACITIGINL